LVNDQRDPQILFYVFIFIYNSLHVSNTSCSSSGETNCDNTVSGNSHSMLVAELYAGWKTTAHTHEIRKRKANWIGHILRRNCLVKQVI